MRGTADRSNLPRALSRAIALGGVLLAAGCAGAVPDPKALAEDIPDTATRDPGVERRARKLIAAVDPAGPAIGAVVEGDLQDLLDDTLDEAEDLVDDHPGSAWAHTAFGVAFAAHAPWIGPRDLDDWKLAEAEFLRAERLAPQDPEIALWHARFLEADSHLEAAAARLEKVLLFVGDRPELLRGLARLRFDLGQERRAIGYDERLIALDSAGPDDLWRLAECRLSVAAEGRDKKERVAGFEAAVEAFERYGAERPDDLDARLGALAARSEIASIDGGDEAIRVLRDAWAQAVKDFNDDPFVHHGAGTAAEIADAPDDAVRHYRQALAIDATFLPAMLDLAALEAGRGETAQAVTIYRQVLALEMPTQRGHRLEPDERVAIEEFVAAYDKGDG